VISELHMKVGSWDLKLNADAPLGLRQSLTFGTIIYVTPTDHGTADAPYVRGQAVFAGILTRRAVRAGMYSGCGIGGMLASAKGQSAYIHPSFATLPATPFSFTQFIARMFASGWTNGVTVGTAYNPTATTVAAFDAANSPGLKTALDTIAAQTGNEWRITPQSTIDYGTPSSTLAPPRWADPSPGLFKNRQIVISPEFGFASQNGGWKLLPPVAWTPETDIESLRNRAIVINASKNNQVLVAPTVPAIVFKTAGGAAMYLWNDRPIIAPSDNTTDITNLATAAANVYCAGLYRIGCTVDLFCPPTQFVPGDTIYIFDPIEGLTGTTHVPVPGMAVPPLPIRVMGSNWPIAAGLGIYAVDPQDRTVITNLTRWVAWESAPTSLTLGSAPPAGPAAATANLIS
jgi:hypothetical protein